MLAKRSFSTPKPIPYSPPPYPLKDADGFDVTFKYPLNFENMKPEDVARNAEWQIKRKTLFCKKKPGTTYDTESTYKIAKISKIISSSTFVICFQHSMTVSEMQVFKQSVTKESANRCVVMPVIKNSFCRIALQNVHDGKYKGMQDLFRGPTAIIAGTNLDHMLGDIKMLLGQEKNLFFLGGLVNGAIVDHIQLKSLGTITSELDLRSSLIGLLLQPPRNLIRSIQSPLNNLVKVLSFTPALAEPKLDETEAKKIDAPA